MTEIDFTERYSRQIRLPLVGQAGQRKLLESGVLIIGMGGLGSPAALYLAAAGVGRLTLADFDRVDESNLQRQIIHGHGDIGELKADSAANTLRALNPAVQVVSLDYSLDYDDFLEQAAKVDLMIDCTDNFPTRFEMNRVSLETRTPLVSAAAIRWEGQVTSFDPRAPGQPVLSMPVPGREYPKRDLRNGRRHLPAGRRARHHAGDGSSQHPARPGPAPRRSMAV